MKATTSRGGYAANDTAVGSEGPHNAAEDKLALASNGPPHFQRPRIFNKPPYTTEQARVSAAPPAAYITAALRLRHLLALCL